MRLIDADALIEDLQYDVELDARALDGSNIVGDREGIQFDKDCKQNCIDLLRNAPTIDPVKHGHWVGISDSEATPRCSNCGRIRFGSSLGYAIKYVPYCEKCGAKMDETQKPCDDC